MRRAVSMITAYTNSPKVRCTACQNRAPPTCPLRVKAKSHCNVTARSSHFQAAQVNPRLKSQPLMRDSAYIAANGDLSMHGHRPTGCCCRVSPVALQTADRVCCSVLVLFGAPPALCRSILSMLTTLLRSSQLSVLALSHR